jgi:hypothetical protein
VLVGVDFGVLENKNSRDPMPNLEDHEKRREERSEIGEARGHDHVKVSSRCSPCSLRALFVLEPYEKWYISS